MYKYPKIRFQTFSSQKLQRFNIQSGVFQLSKLLQRAGRRMEMVDEKKLWILWQRWVYFLLYCNMAFDVLVRETKDNESNYINNHEDNNNVNNNNVNNNDNNNDGNWQQQ